MTAPQALPPIQKEPAPANTRRILLTLSYDGTGYGGWQMQHNAPSIQQCLEEALCKLTGESIRVTGASRTDAGVHALGQRAHFDTASRIPPEKYPFALNACLPRDIRALEGREVSGSFHARFDAKAKLYTYRVYNAPHASALYRHLCAHVPQPLDLDAMVRSLPPLLGTHDFAAFQAAGGAAKTTFRTLHEAVLTREGPWLTLTVSGNAFLYNMVRIIAGTLIQIGQGKLSPIAFAQALDTKNRLSLGVTAPPSGLELTRVDYA